MSTKSKQNSARPETRENYRNEWGLGLHGANSTVFVQDDGSGEGIAITCFYSIPVTMVQDYHSLRGSSTPLRADTFRMEIK